MASCNVNFTLTDQQFEYICDTAGYCIGYWAHSAEVTKEVYSVRSEDEIFYITKEKLEQTLLKLAFEKNKINTYTRGEFVKFIADPDEETLDADCVDLLIQYACFGELLYA